MVGWWVGGLDGELRFVVSQVSKSRPGAPIHLGGPPAPGRPIMYVLRDCSRELPSFIILCTLVMLR